MSNPAEHGTGADQDDSTSGFQLIPQASRLLAELASPISRDAFLRKSAADGLDLSLAERIWSVLEDTGLIREARSTAQSQAFAETFGAWRSQRGMLADTCRTHTFERAIAAQVKDGMSVADVGSGSGILSFFAARAGAARVYALESTAMIDDSRRVAEANGLDDRLSFVQGDAARFISPEPVDVVMGEWAGMMLFEEWRHFDAFAQVRDANLKPGGTVIPAKARLYLSPVDDSRLYVERGPGFWQRPVWGFDFSLVHEEQLDRTRRIIVQADKRTLLHPIELLSIDCLKDTSSAFFFEREFDIDFSHAATCHGFIGYFSLELAPGVVLDTSPMSIDTHWHQSYFPIEQIHIERGDTLAVVVRSMPDEFTGSPVLEIRVELRRGGCALTAQQRTYTLDDTQG